MEKTDFKQLQLLYYREPEKKRFYWQTGNPYIRSKERKLLEPLMNVEIKGPILEVGCGEGANLVNLRSMGFKPFFYGIDFCFKKVRFASFQKNIDSRFVCGTAVRLPFKDETFNAVLLRDLLHHVDNDRENVLKEAFRVCQKSGYIFVIEGNGSKLTNRMFRFIRAAEKGIVNSTKEKIEVLLRKLQISSYCINMKEPFNLFRFFLHYRYGVSALGEIKWIRMILDFIESVTQGIIPEKKWAYIVVVIEK